MSMDKKEIRRKFSEIRKLAKSKMKDAVISAKLLADEKICQADTVLLYASFRTEVDTWHIAKNLLLKNIWIAFPKCGENGIMTFHIVKSLNQLEDSVYGICEPDASLPEPEITNRTVCIVPALAFTEKGDRLGMGGGYYDRFLEQYPDLYTIGIAYEACIADEIPTEKHDFKVRSIVTEERMVLCDE